MSVIETPQTQRESGDRTGSKALRLLASPINVHVLRALSEKPKSLLDLRREAGFPPQTTMRGYMRQLDRTGVLTKKRHAQFPGNVDIELAKAGRALLFVDEAIRDWLATAPNGPIAPGSPGARSAVKALVEAWASNMLRALAARPLSLTELDSVIGSLSYPALERRLAAMRVAGQVEKLTGQRGARPYAVTEWLRRAVAPIVAAVRWERMHIPELTVPISPRDVEAAFLLSVPLVVPPPDYSSSCRLAVELRGRNQTVLAGVMLSVEDGRLAQCTSRLEGRADASAVGTPEAWLDAVADGDFAELELSGDREIAAQLVEELHRTLFGGALSSLAG